MLNFRVKEELTKEDEQLLRDIRFAIIENTSHKHFDNFAIVLNPIMENGSGKVVINYEDCDLKDDCIDDVFDIFEIWTTINELIANEIIYIIKDGE